MLTKLKIFENNISISTDHQTGTNPENVIESANMIQFEIKKT